MITETFHPNKVKQFYERFAEKGRQLPDGISYINSWIDEDIKTCYQVMESDTPEKIKEWSQHWKDLQILKIPVITSAEAKEKVNTNAQFIISHPSLCIFNNANILKFLGTEF